MMGESLLWVTTLLWPSALMAQDPQEDGQDGKLDEFQER
jgi:hypothetical protein